MVSHCSVKDKDHMLERKDAGARPRSHQQWCLNCITVTVRTLETLDYFCVEILFALKTGSTL